MPTDNADHTDRPDNAPETRDAFRHDWAQEWKDLQKFRRRADDAAYWDERSKTFGLSDAPSAYVNAFMDKMDLLPGESVFDMGCGTGALSIPLAKEGHPVVAADFSGGMLGVLREAAERNGLTNIETVQMSWEDDWEARGVKPKSVDVAIASRSIAVEDLAAALDKLTAVARRRVCITVTAFESPRVDERAMRDIGLVKPDGVARLDLQFVFNILCDRGFRPSVSYIDGSRVSTYDTPKDAFEQYRAMIPMVVPNISDADRTAAEQRLHTWLDEHLIPNPEAGQVSAKGHVQGAWTLNVSRSTSWAFVSWGVE